MGLDEITEVLKALREQPVPDSRITCLSLCKGQKAWSGADYSQLYIVQEHETQIAAPYSMVVPKVKTIFKQK